MGSSSGNSSGASLAALWGNVHPGNGACDPTLVTKDVTRVGHPNQRPRRAMNLTHLCTSVTCPVHCLEYGRSGTILGMRMNLITQALNPSSGRGSFQVSLTIRPACGLPGEYQYPTDSASLLRLLRQQTDLPSSVLERFEGNLNLTHSAKLLGVELSDGLLTKIGYFVD